MNNQPVNSILPTDTMAAPIRHLITRSTAMEMSSVRDVLSYTLRPVKNIALKDSRIRKCSWCGLERAVCNICKNGTPQIRPVTFPDMGLRPLL